MTHDELVKNWRENAERNAERNYEFLRSLKFRNYGFDPDELAHKLHEQAFSTIDCCRCANCCKTMATGMSDEDLERIAEHLDMTVEQFTSKYVTTRDDGYGQEVQLLDTPCAFLDENGQCSIYEVRPAECREYPHTDKDEFTCRTHGLASNALACPAVFWIIEKMRRRAQRPPISF